MRRLNRDEMVFYGFTSTIFAFIIGNAFVKGVQKRKEEREFTKYVMENPDKYTKYLEYQAAKNLEDEVERYKTLLHNSNSGYNALQRRYNDLNEDYTYLKNEFKQYLDKDVNHLNTLKTRYFNESIFDNPNSNNDANKSEHV